MVFVDDAKSQVMLLQFVPSESLFAYFQAMRVYIETRGLPIAQYSDNLEDLFSIDVLMISHSN